MLILIWRLVPVPPITNGWYWHSLQGGQAQTLYISTSVRREDRGQSSSQGLADTEIQNSVGNCSACTLSCSPSTTDKDTLVLVPRLYNNPLPVECECYTISVLIFPINIACSVRSVSLFVCLSPLPPLPPTSNEYVCWLLFQSIKVMNRP